MAQKGTILVGTIGQGVMMSLDDGESWTRASVRQGMHPLDPSVAGGGHAWR